MWRRTMVIRSYLFVALAVIFVLRIDCIRGRGTPEKTPPHIVFMLADDLGNNNLAYLQRKHNNMGSDGVEVQSPTLDRLARTGLQLDRMYTFKYCSPSRSSFLSGRLPIHVTQNNKNNLVTNPGGADLRMTLLPQVLRNAPRAYSTHMIGKWHVGARSNANLPIRRGFDAHFGFLKGGEDHINQRSGDAGLKFVDLWRDRTPAYGENGTFSTHLYAREAQTVIRDHVQRHSAKNEDDVPPLFMFLAWQATHTPLEMPVGDTFHPVPNDTSVQTRARMNKLVELLDAGVANVTRTLEEVGIWNRTLLIFQADNGGWIQPDYGGNNWPLRGGKVSDFEGGVRTVAFLNGGFLPTSLRGTTNTGLIHIADWFATLSHVAGVSSLPDDGPAVPQVDSVNMWSSLMVPNATSNNRVEVPLSYCNAEAECDSPGQVGDSALISGRWKIIRGKQAGLGFYQGPLYPNMTSELVVDPGCAPDGCLFDIIADPSETQDLKIQFPELFQNLSRRLDEIGSTVFQTNYTDSPHCADASAAFTRDAGFLAPRCGTGRSEPGHG